MVEAAQKNAAQIPARQANTLKEKYKVEEIKGGKTPKNCLVLKQFSLFLNLFGWRKYTETLLYWELYNTDQWAREWEGLAGQVTDHSFTWKSCLASVVQGQHYLPLRLWKIIYSVYEYLLAGGRTVRRRQSSYPKSKERQESTISWNYKNSSRKDIQRDDPNNPLKGKEISKKDIFLVIENHSLITE